MPDEERTTFEALAEKLEEAKSSQRDLLIKLAEKKTTLWHDADQNCFASIKRNGHDENMAVHTRAFRTWLTGEFYRAHKGAPGKQAIEDALATIAAKAMFDGEEHEPAVRMAQHGDAYFLDLGNTSWSAVKITSAEWKIVINPPVKFIRPRGMRALPVPEPDGSIYDLQSFINTKSDDDFRLIVTAITAAMRPRGPYVVMIINGEQGAAKSTTNKAIRVLVDPNQAPVRSGPRAEHDLVIAAKNGWMIALDNLSTIQPWLSDALCRLSTGAAFATRQLYTDDSEMLFAACRPIVMNGIPDLATRGDLADRALVFQQPQLEDDKRLDETEFWQRFDGQHGRMLGALLDVVVAGLAYLDDVVLARKPRMADFAKWGAAIAPAIGWTQDEFLEAYRANRAVSVETTLEADHVAAAVQTMLTRRDSWSGEPGELWHQLTDQVGVNVANLKEWPKNASALSGRIKRAAPALRQFGISVQFTRDNTSERKRKIVLAKGDIGQDRKSASGASAASGIDEKAQKTNGSGPDAVSDTEDISDGVSDAVETTPSGLTH